MFNREFDDFLLELKSYKTENILDVRAEKRGKPAHIQLQIRDDNWKQNLQSILHFSFINFTGISYYTIRRCVYELL